MIDFKVELKRYEKALEIDDIEESVKKDEETDFMEILQHISSQIQTTSKG